MATESVATRVDGNPDNVLCKVQQIAGVLAVMAQSEADRDEMRDALWGALALAHEAESLAQVVVDTYVKERA